MLSGGKIIKTFLKHNLILTVTCVRLVQSSTEVRVRFAPSPTGKRTAGLFFENNKLCYKSELDFYIQWFLHLGGLRTALFNFLFARSHGGTFILRIEDTDQSRLVDGALNQLQEDLEWTGIIPDEGPEAGGDYGPYMQSKRLDIYKAAIETLIENGAAYHCFCTEYRLELLRKDALRRGQAPRYDNRCQHLSKEEVQAKLNSSMGHCVRLKLIPGCETFNDLVYGNISHDVSASEGDPVIFKSDGFPTYHLANVVDDHHMRVTHVLRGVEWQASTPKHLMLYKGFGWTPPHFAHLPLLLNSDGTKLSKRQGDISIKHYRSMNIIPRALVNFVTFSGGGFHRDNSDTVRSLDMTQLSKEFDLSLVGVASCRVSLDRLDDFNHVELVRQMSNETELAALVTAFRAVIIDTYKDRLESLDLDEQYVRSILIWSQKRITRLSQLVEPQFSYLWVRPPTTPLDLTHTEWIRDVCEKLKMAEDFSQKPLTALLRTLVKNKNIKMRDFMHIMRLLLCGLKEGPAVAEMLEMLGRDNSLARLQASLQESQQPTTDTSKYNCSKAVQS